MNVEEVQRRLWEQSSQHGRHRQSATPMFPANPYDGRVRNLMDLLHHPQWLRRDKPGTIAPESEAAGNGAVERTRTSTSCPTSTSS